MNTNIIKTVGTKIVRAVEPGVTRATANTSPVINDALERTPAIEHFEKAATRISKPDILEDVVKLEKPLSKFSNFEQRIINAGTEDELTILGQDISKLLDSGQLDNDIALKYVTKYQQFYRDIYKGKNISPNNIFKDVFRKNFTDEETRMLCAKYKAILQEPNIEKYVEKLFSQVKKDFGLEYIPFELKQEVKGGIGYTTRGGTSDYLDYLKLTYYKDNPLNRHKLFGLIMHEVSHARQHEIAMATDFGAYVKALALKLKQMPEHKDTPIDKIIQFVAQRIGPERLSLIRGKYGVIDKGSELYRKGISYIDGTLNYEGVKEFTAEAFMKYKLQPIEDEAYHIQSKANELYYYLTK